MKVYQKLSIASSTENLVKLLTQWKNENVPGWTYEDNLTEDYVRNIFTTKDKAACFRVNEENLEDANLWLFIDKSELRVTNIIPLKIFHLNYDQYNKIITRFYEIFVTPIKQERLFKIKLTRPYPNIIDLANKTTAQKLTTWEAICNHDNGNLHPQDEQKWFDFVISAVLTKSPLDREELKRWLIEDKSWIDATLVDRLCDEYENETRLLSYFIDKDYSK